MKREYEINGETFFVLQDGEGALQAFNLAKVLIIKKLAPKINKNISHLLDNRLFEFETDGAGARLEYSNWSGTELSILNGYGEFQVMRIRKLAQEVQSELDLL